MQIFKTFCRLFWRKLPFVSLYIGIFIVIGVVSSLTQDSGSSGYASASLKIAVIDRDHTAVSSGLREYLDSLHEIVEIKDSKEVLQEELFYRNIEYVAIIPEGFGEGLVQGGETDIEVVKVPGSTNGIYVDRQIDTYFKSLAVFLKSGYGEKEASEKAAASHTVKAEVENIKLGTEDAPAYQYYFNFLNYILMAVLFFTLGGNMVSLNKDEIRRRTLSSSTSAGSRNCQLAAAMGVVSLLIWGALQVMAVIVYGQPLLQDSMYPFYLLNSLVFTMVIAAISLLIGVLVKKRNTINGISNIFSLGLGFLGGIFVPQAIMGSGVLAVAHFIPSFWTVRAVDVLAGTDILSGNNASVYWNAIAIQAIFFAAFLAVALTVGKFQGQKS